MGNQGCDYAGSYRCELRSPQESPIIGCFEHCAIGSIDYIFRSGQPLQLLAAYSCILHFAISRFLNGSIPYDNWTEEIWLMEKELCNIGP